MSLWTIGLGGTYSIVARLGQLSQAPRGAPLSDAAASPASRTRAAAAVEAKAPGLEQRPDGCYRSGHDPQGRLNDGPGRETDGVEEEICGYGDPLDVGDAYEQGETGTGHKMSDYFLP